LGYLDFRKDPLKPWMDVEELIATIKQEAGSDTIFREGKVSCSLFYPLSRTEEVTELIRKHIVSKVGDSQLQEETIVI